MKTPGVYILANIGTNGTLYAGVTSHRARRVWERKSNAIDGFAKKYGINLFVYYEIHAAMPDAILREKQVKRWNGALKMNLILQMHPEWRDPYEDIS